MANANPSASDTGAVKVGTVPVSNAVPDTSAEAIETPGSVAVTVTSEDSPGTRFQTTTCEPACVISPPLVASNVYTTPGWKLAMSKVNPSVVGVTFVSAGAVPAARAEPSASPRRRCSRCERCRR